MKQKRESNVKRSSFHSSLVPSMVAPVMLGKDAFVYPNEITSIAHMKVSFARGEVESTSANLALDSQTSQGPSLI
jgi:hypothetical protein